MRFYTLKHFHTFFLLFLLALFILPLRVYELFWWLPAHTISEH